ncbi:MAG: hypothetical protein JWP82_1012 [Humibacillus sp.]|nr:hypothetical protein [Humibacillus sp.]
MTTSRFALVIGLVLGAVATFGGFGYLIIVAVFAAVGWGVGLVLEGKVDLQSVLGSATDRR